MEVRISNEEALAIREIFDEQEDLQELVELFNRPPELLRQILAGDLCPDAGGPLFGDGPLNPARHRVARTQAFAQEAWRILHRRLPPETFEQLRRDHGVTRKHMERILNEKLA